MQKKLIAIAIAAALAAPAAAMAAADDKSHEAASGGTHPAVIGTTNTTLYGRIHTSIDKVTGVALDDNKVSVNTNGSRFGVKGNEDLGGGLKAVFQVETNVNATGGGTGSQGSNTANANGAFTGQLRDTFIGLAGSFGTIKAGRLGYANQWVYDSNLFVDQLGDAAQFTGLGLAGRGNGEVMYSTPNMSGFSADLTYLPGLTTVNAASNTAATHGKNSYGMKLGYAAAGATAKLAYFNVKTVAATVETTTKPLSLAAGYDFGQGLVTAQYVKAKVEAAGVKSDDRKVWNIGGKFNINANSVVKAQYSKAREKIANANNGGKMFAVGYDYNFSKRTGMYVVYAKTKNDTAGALYTVNGWGHQAQNGAPAAGEDPKGFGVGLTHNF